MKRTLVSLPEGIWDVIDSDLRGKLGENDSEIIRNIVVGYLSQNGYFVKKEQDR